MVARFEASTMQRRFWEPMVFPKGNNVFIFLLFYYFSTLYIIATKLIFVKYFTVFTRHNLPCSLPSPMFLEVVQSDWLGVKVGAGKSSSLTNGCSRASVTVTV
jgi:hypothetical protein